MKALWFIWRGLAVAALLLTFTGCGSNNPPTYPVRGTVTYRGQPVAVAQVMFNPDAGRSASAVTENDGTFTLTTFATGDGALVGVHRVTIAKVESLPARDPANPYGARAKSLLPARYGNLELTPLTEEVKKGKNEFRFDLAET